jgi:hypothetical protein
MGVIQPVRRALRPAGKTIQAVARWRRLSFNEAPPIFANAKPKSGSHLLLQVLAGFTRIMPYAYVEAEPVRTITKDGRRRKPAEIREELERLPRGVIGWGYVEPTPENTAFLCRPGRVNYFIYRDPRDMLVSQVFFATDMYEDHGMHAYYKSLPDFGARLQAAITGVEQDGLKMVSVKQRYEGVLRWLAQKQVLCLRYEDLINHREPALRAMLDEVEKTGYHVTTPREHALSVLAHAIQPKKSRTFRAGKTGDWKQLFTSDHKQLFKDVADDLLAQLGYEQNNDW